MVTNNPPGRPGGSLVVVLKSEPKTLNPVLAEDAPSLTVLRCLNADLIHINRATQKTEPAIAKSWAVSPDGLQYTLQLRHGLRFSDGQPAGADDVVFSFRVYLDEKIDSPQRDLLIVGGRPITVQKLGPYTVRFILARPYAAAERLFDGIAILPRHLLENTYRSGGFSAAWNLSARPNQFAGLGPFRLKEYVPGQRIVLERNPYYWKQDRRGDQLPYLSEVAFQFVSSEDAQVITFQAGGADLLSGFGAEDYAVLQRQSAARHYHLFDLGPGLEYNFLFFNLNDIASKNLPEIARKQAWFSDVRFRQAVSDAIDRAAIVRLVYDGRATPLWSQVTPGNRLWVDPDIPHPPRSVDQARALLKSAGFSWRADGSLADSSGNSVEFSILTSSSNAQRTKIATLVQNDLAQLGMNVHVVSLDFHSMVNRLLTSYDFEAAMMGLVSGDADPTAEMNVWMSSGDTHLWHPDQTKPATPWEAEIDRLMQQQLVTLDYAKRKKLYDQVQEIVARELPVICLVSPDILVGASDRVANFQPAILEPYTLWNIDELYIR
ncbi:MAG TPA: ABC transporter substrate-binding protein [Verrucomicrobiae bacterium]|nr:ABC transporter substrate-binding protein [Verrucomicrobiae bacterium]